MQVWVTAQDPHEIWPPQPSETNPQLLPKQAKAFGHGVQIGAHVPFAQTMPTGHSPTIAPQTTRPPQPLDIEPQERPSQAASTDNGEQPHSSRTPPPPHVLGARHDPALHRPPHPSASPQAFPAQLATQPASRVSRASGADSLGVASGSRS